MPIYEYICSACNEHFEEISAPDAPSPVCPRCGAQGASRQLSLPGQPKRGAFPFKPGPAHPLAAKMAAGQSPCQTCGGQCGYQDENGPC